MLPDLLSCYQICCGVTADIFRNLLFTKFVIFFGFAVMLPSLLLCLLPCCRICCHVPEFAVRSPEFAVMFTSLLLDLGSIFSWCFPKFCVAFCKFAPLFPNLLSSFRICCAVSRFAFLLPNLLHFFLNLLHSFPFMLPNLLWCFRMCCTIWCTFSRFAALFPNSLSHGWIYSGFSKYVLYFRFIYFHKFALTPDFLSENQLQKNHFTPNPFHTNHSWLLLCLISFLSVSGRVTLLCCSSCFSPQSLWSKRESMLPSEAAACCHEAELK